MTAEILTAALAVGAVFTAYQVGKIRGHKFGFGEGWREGYFQHPAQLRTAQQIRDREGRFSEKPKPSKTKTKTKTA